MKWKVFILVLLPLVSCQTCPPQCTSCDNGVANCLGTGLRDIPKNFPPDTRVLDLSNNQLTELSSNSFQELPLLQTLRMSGNGISEVLSRSFIKLSSLMSLDISNNPTVFIQDEAFLGLANLRMLSITNTKMTRIGRSLQDVTNLHTLNMVSNQIESLDDENFEKNEQLRMIDLSQNQITRISSKVFVNLKYLRYLSLSSNPITSVPQLEFTSTILHLVDFTNCLLEEVPGKMPESVADFRLGNNKLTELTAKNFQNITNLRLITLNNNKITKVEDKAFGYLEKLKEIWLSNNKLKFIPRLLPRNLHKLFLDHNEIYEVGSKIFPINSKLEILSLDSNAVERISDHAWDGMTMLKSINLNANKLKVVKTGAFSNITALESLKLSNNPIEVIEDGSMKDLTSLNDISLSYLNTYTTELGRDFITALTNVENINFVNSPALVKSFLALIESSSNAVLIKTKLLSLQHNELETLPMKLKQALPNVEKLFIDGNPWYCDTRLKWLKDWMKSSHVVFYSYDPPVCEAPSNLREREITTLADGQFAKPREVIVKTDNAVVAPKTTSVAVAETKIQPVNKKKKKKNGKKKNKKRKNKNRKKKKKNKKNRKKKKKNKRGKRKRDRRHNTPRKRRCVIDANGKKICPRRLRKCTIGLDGKRVCPKKKKQIKTVDVEVSTAPPVVQG